MKRNLLPILFLLGIIFFTYSQGSRILAPNYPGLAALDIPATPPTANNDDFAWLLHDAFGTNFLDPAAPTDERLYVYLKDGETLRYGIRRVAKRQSATLAYAAAPVTGGANEDLSILIFNSSDAIVRATYYDGDATSGGGSTLLTTNGGGTAGLIGSVAESLLGPEFVFNSTTYNSGGYTPIEYTNNTGTDQAFYIAFLQDDYTFVDEATLITDVGSATIVDINEQAWYDLWDFTVYDDNVEKTGRLYSKSWNFTAQFLENEFADEVELFALIPSVIGGVNAGNYVKKIDVGGIVPLSAVIYASSIGADGTVTDTNGDGTIDFQDARQSQDLNIGEFEYDIFLQNPDVELFPTTAIPSVEISNAYFYCNAAGTGGEASISFNTNQVGFIAIIIDLNGIGGYQAGTTDVIVEAEITTIGTQTIRWDGLDGLGAQVSNGSPITISGRFTSGAVNVPIFDVESNPNGIQMLDVRPSTSFDLIYWDDSSIGGTGATPEAELDGTNVDQHLWTDGDDDLLNTWSFGYYQASTQNVTFSFECDIDGDGVLGTADLDNDNDGVADSVEGDHQADADADGIPNYLDADFAGYTDSNGDGVDDNFDPDLDGIPSSLDVDSDNDGIPDMVENGLSDTDLDGTLDNGSGITDTYDNGLDDAYDLTCVGPQSGNATSQTNNGATNPANALGNTIGTFTQLAFGNDIDLNMGLVVPSGSTITLQMSDGVGGLNAFANVSQSLDGIVFSNVQLYTATTLAGNPEPFDYVLSGSAQYIRIDGIGNNFPVDVYLLSYSFTGCPVVSALTINNTDSDGVANYLDLDSDNDGIVDVIEAGGSADTSTGQISNFTDANDNGLNDMQESVALSLPDTDADGSLADYLDIDSDNDGILDNIEGQDSENAIATAAGDTDNDGLLDVYDPNNGGTLLTPTDTDSDGTEDYLSADADGDGVDDFVEGWDADRDGFSDLDTNEDRDISDETGHNADANSDGLWDIFDTAGTAPTPNTDGSGKSNWQDTDDDNDGVLTSGEDSNNNGNWTDDKTQGQGGSADVPDYLFRGDYDGDAIADANDADSDNDGILDSEEDNGETIDPSGDEDGDGIANYQDTSDATVTSGLSATTDSNSDGVYDVYDSDLDGIPDFLDLDSDNDGIWDAVEADGGSVPNGLNTTTGQFELQDPDNDGLMNYVDTDDVSAGGVSDLANPDTDGDGLNDYIDIDSDADGITDIIETQTESGFIALSNLDSDGDGIDDAFDPSDGGVLIDPINSDGEDLRDYLDTDSDNDTVLDANEGDDVDQNGFGDWDTNSNQLVDDAGFNADSDGDGLADIFDTVTLGTTGNETGSNSDLPNTDGIDTRNWRDNDDDNDGTLTEDEDANSNGDLTDDQTGGQSGSIPDYLFYGDFDGDGIPDASDTDSDNDGIADADEDGGEAVDPSADADGDGIPNYKDPDDPGLSSTVDSNGDGVYDVYDTDLDGIPDFRDRDADNDGTPDLVEAGGTDADGDGEVDGNTDTDGDGIPDNVDVKQTGGVDSDADNIDDAFDASITLGTDTDGDDIIDSADLDIDGDGILNTYDATNGGTPITLRDSDGDGIEDIFDLDSDNDGIPDIIESGGVDSDGDGKIDDLTDNDLDGLPDAVDSDNSGTALPRPDSDSDGVLDFLDVDSDNDGITDTVENGGLDTNNDGAIDDAASDSDGDGLADSVDPDSAGTPIANVDTDGDGIDDYLDLDVDNDGYPDILEAGGTDSDNDGIVNNMLDSDSDTVPDNVDVDNSGTNGGSGSDADGDEIDNSFDVDLTGGNDADGDGIDDAFDSDADGNGYDDDVEATPYGQEDKEGDGKKDFRDMDSDGDGIADVIEFGETINSLNAQIDGFADANSNGWNDAQEATPINPPNTDGDSFPDYQDIDADDDGIPDNIEGQTNATYAAISDTDSDNDGLDDAYDPDNGGSIISPTSTDGGDADFLDTDADGDSVPDNVEGDNDDRSQFADWDTDSDNDITDEVGYNVDTDNDGLWDIFDNNSGSTSENVTGSNSDGMDTDSDGVWDFQDVDDDGDGLLTISQGGGNEDADSDGDPTDDFDAGGTPIPNYLYGDQDEDGDGVDDDSDLDSDNDGFADTQEDGGTGIDPSGDIDSDGVQNAYDFDMDGDGIPNTSDTDANGDATPDSFSLTDSNGDNIADEFDKDLDGIPDFRDLDSDNDGIADLVEFGQADTDENGTIDGFTDVSGGGFANYSNTTGCSTTLLTIGSSTTGPTGDDANVNPTLPFDFEFFGTTVSSGATTTLNSNGWFSFDNIAPANSFNAVTIPNGTYTNTIFLNHRDHTPNVGGTITFGTNGVTPNRIFIVEFNAVTFFNGGGTSTVQLQLYETTNEVRIATSNFNPDTGENTTQGLNQDGATSIVVTGRNAAQYTITTSECQSFVPQYNGNGLDDTIDATPLSSIDTDSDGIDNHLDLDSDNDGISDNVEAQLTASYVTPVAGDTDGDGILDVYDEDISAGNALDPIDTESTGTDDYVNTDSDGDGVLDFVEAFDTNADGFSSLDTDSDGLISDESGFASDTDNDGILLIFDAVNGIGTIANITGTNAERQDTDSDAAEDWRDLDDDGDGTDTGDGSAGSGEDNNSNGDWSDDFGQGGGSTPDYLFNADSDGDGIADETDLDSDNDGILNTDEYAGTTYAVGSDVSGLAGTPFGDSDGDGIYNYLDDSDVNFSITDVNGDGIDDMVDQDRDGVPNFFDLDSDNDGIMDAIEANSGLVPTGFSLATGRYGVDNSGGDDDDDDNDGLNDNLDADNGGTALLNINTDIADGDSLNDFLDLDSDNDGITDHVESQTTAALVNPTGTDTDADGLDDTFDADNGGTAITPTNSDAGAPIPDAIPDYIDTDSDNDNDGIGALLDVIEGYDANRNGFSELDSDLDGLLTDETGYNADSDGDGLWDLFDSFSSSGTSNITGSRANLQDTDSDGTLDFRDQDDDGDALTSAVEDNDSDGDWTNDKIQGGGATPDYLFFNDTDGDRIADGADQDGDNDGVLDDDEYDDTSYRDPFGDQDGDGVFNYNDSDDPTDLLGGALVDSNSDGIWDVYDWDLDGTPNFFDLDNDNDGIPDIIEAGGTDSNNDGKIDGIADADGDGLFDNVDVDVTAGTDANLDGIDDSFQDGTDSDGDGIEDTADFDDDGDGIINVVDGDEGGTPHPIPDTDGDGVNDIFDYDSDNDGILDLIEAGGSDFNGDGQLDSFGDTDGDGWGNSVDSDNGGTAHSLFDSNSDLTEDYIQIDADSESSNDWIEGFDDDEDGDHLNDYESRRTTYETANGNPGHYPTTDVGPANGTPDYLDDADSDGTPNFLDPDNGTYFRDSDTDGIVDFFDIDANGTSYASVSGAPDLDDDGIPDYRDNVFDAPLPLDWISFEASYVKGDVDLLWVTANEVNVSHFDIEHSIDGETFKIVGNLDANNATGVNTYTHVHLSPVIGINYYRINQVDFDGKSDYSWTRAVTAANNKISFIVYPNPAQESITIRSEAIVTGNVELIDVQGKILMKEDFKGTNSTSINLNDLKSGVYQLRIITPNGVVYKRIVKR